MLIWSSAFHSRVARHSENENDMYGLRYADFFVPLVKGMQEQQAQIEELKAANAMLSEKIAKMEEELSRR